MNPNNNKQVVQTSSGWIIQWFTDENKRPKWNIKTPTFKECKKRKEYFSSTFSDVWYKAPFKYHCHIEVEGMNPDENILAYVDLNYEDGQKVVDNSATHTGVISKNEKYFIHHVPVLPNQKQSSEVTIGPFQFHICSYKQDGRKFRMIVYLLSSNPTKKDSSGQQIANCTTCCLISPPFTIRAKKPGGLRLKKQLAANKRKIDDTNNVQNIKKQKLTSQITQQSINVGSGGSSSALIEQHSNKEGTSATVSGGGSADGQATEQEIMYGCLRLFNTLGDQQKIILLEQMINCLYPEQREIIKR